MLLADNWYSGYGISRTGTTMNHGNFEIYNGSITESQSGPAKSPAIWVGQSNNISPAPRIHDLTLTTYTTDSSPIFGTVSAGGWQIFNNKIYYSATAITNRSEFLGYAIWIGDQEQDPASSIDDIHNNTILAAPQGGIRDTHQNAQIHNNDINFNSTYTNDFCVDAPADAQEVHNNTCHPRSGRGIHTNANNVFIHNNSITVQELAQNREYGGCELRGAFGIQVEFDTSFLSLPPRGVRVANNTINAVAAACDASGIRITSMTPIGGVTFANNQVTTSNQGSGGLDYALSYSDTIDGGVSLRFSGNTFQSDHAFITADWDGANVYIDGGQTWNGSPQYSIDDENGYYLQSQSGPTFWQAINVQDYIAGKIHCGPYAAGPVRAGSNSTTCN